MTELLEQAVELVRSLPPETQDDLARLMMRIADNPESVYRLTPEEEADLTAADGEISRGELASDDEVAAVFSKHRL